MKIKDGVLQNVIRNAGDFFKTLAEYLDQFDRLEDDGNGCLFGWVGLKVYKIDIHMKLDINTNEAYAIEAMKQIVRNDKSGHVSVVSTEVHENDVAVACAAQGERMVVTRGKEGVNAED